MSRDIDLLVVESARDAAQEAAARLAAVAAGGRLALSGGSTPAQAYELAAQRRPDWSGASVWWSDERCVPPDDERSNFRLARESLLDRLDAPPGEVHRIRGELAPEEAADEYARALGETELDLVLLGIGPDGHTASLFPDAPTLGEQDRRVVAAEAGHEPFVPRVTLTIPAFAAARIVLFLVTGLSKAEAVARAFASPASEATPASLVRSAEGQTIAILDREAASLLP